MRPMTLLVAAAILLAVAGCGDGGEPDRPYAARVELLGWPSDCMASREGVCIRGAASGRDATCVYIPAGGFFSWSLREPCGPDACIVMVERGATLLIACPFPLTSSP